MDTLPIFSRENSTFSSTAPQELFPTEEPFDLIDFMSVAQRRMVDFLPITWQPALEAIGGGGSADISQSLINLRTSFAFKRLVRRRNRRNNINLQVLISEILVLQSEPIRAHPNIVNLLGICWEFEAESGSIAPVLVFPKAHLGDLQTYMSTERRKTIGFETRLGLSIHIAQAIATLHDCNIVHGDIKPQNILIFKDDRGSLVAKVTDFGYSCLGKSMNDRVYLPKTSSWVLAPEWNHRGFSIDAAKKLDVFSFGMLCIWILFKEAILDRGIIVEKAIRMPQKLADQNLSLREGSVECILQDLKVNKKILDAVREIITDTIPEDIRAKHRLQDFFIATLREEQSLRESNFENLISYLDPSQKISASYSSKKEILTAHSHAEFRVSPSMLQLLWMDFQLRVKITELLRARSVSKCPTCSRNAAFQLAICYHVGFGTPKDDGEAQAWLKRSTKSFEDLQSELDLVERDFVFRSSQFLDLWLAGSISPIDITQHYRERQLLSSVEEEYRREITDLENCFGVGHFLVSSLKELLAGILQAEGKLTEATALYGQIIEEKQKVMNSQHPSMFTAISNMASILEEQGQWKQAEELALSVMSNSKVLLGADYPGSILYLANLSSIFGKLRRWEEAEALDREALGTSLKHFGREHPSTVKAMGNLAVTLENRGQLKEAEDLETQVVKMNKRLHGVDHPDTLTSIANLAETYGIQERWKEAEELHVQAIDARKRVLGPDHRDTLTSHAGLATNLARQKRWDEAEEIFTQLVAVSRRVFGAEHPENLKILSNLVTVYRNQARLQEAYDLGLKVLEAQTRTLGEKHPTTMTSMASQATTLWQDGHFDDALMLFWDAVNLNLEVYGPKDPLTLVNTHNLAVCLRSQEDYSGAMTVMKEVVRLRTEVLGVDHADTKNSAQFIDLWQCPGGPDLD